MVIKVISLTRNDVTWVKGGRRRATVAWALHKPLVAYAGRCPDEFKNGAPKYPLPHGFRKSLGLFNQHWTVKESAVEPLVLVERFFNCMRVWQADVTQTHDGSFHNWRISKRQRENASPDAPSKVCSLPT